MFESWTARAAELEREVYALSLAFRDERTPFAAKVVILGVVAYAVSPIDAIPDFIPVVGYLDDLVVVPLGVLLALRLLPDGVMADCRERAGDELDAGRVRWVAAAFTVAAWVVVAALIAQYVWFS